ncbi:FGFR1 oncogene partner 2 homolog isoform X2 [Homarus americanus]|uniref:FGFR1 oncogene partner 2 homolog isoform X2 n=1 Tax=Homarus americanus TaxID=6706 RepID=UPI001C457BA8|nr:FGFR1 oncogene partner 2 homolog isoform X2 [Homarus americanus]
MYDKMSVLQQVLTDARKLATRLRDHDSSADSLLSQAQGMFKQVESMKEYCEEMNELNEAANNRPRSALIHSIQQENRHIRQLQQENKELRLALEEHQNVMELIMSKYRQQVAKLVTVNSKQMQPNTQEQAKLAAQIERISEMVAVMRKAASLGDDESQQQQRLITALATENKGLREMLNIASLSGSLQPATSAVDAGTQTEKDSPKCEEQSTSQDQEPVEPTSLQEEEKTSLESHKNTES